MHLIGELRDKRMVDEIITQLGERGILATSEYVSAHETYLISVVEEKSVDEATDFFRVKMGFKKPQKIDQEWVKIKSLPRGDTTFIILMGCVFIYLFSFSQIGVPLYDTLFFGKVDSSPFYEIMRGQIWRLVTPIFLHMSFMHILFNMLWFKDLGYLIEFNFKKNFLILFVLGTGFFSNLCQYLVSGPQFGGMSGVLYAMLGFIWVYKKLSSDFEFSIPRPDMGIMIGWYLLCLTGLLGPIANTAHGAGLVSGILVAVALKFNPSKKECWKYISIALFFLVFTLGVEGYKLGGRYYFLLWKQ
jgi:GlpG protein